MDSLNKVFLSGGDFYGDFVEVPSSLQQGQLFAVVKDGATLHYRLHDGQGVFVGVDAPTEEVVAFTSEVMSSGDVAASDGVITKEELRSLNKEEYEGYELVNKETGEIIPVTGLTFGDGTGNTDVVVVSIEGGEVTFDNANKEGNLVDSDLSNPDYAIRQKDTNLTPNNDGIVTDEGKELNPSQETPNQAA